MAESLHITRTLRVPVAEVMSVSEPGKPREQFFPEAKEPGDVYKNMFYAALRESLKVSAATINECLSCLYRDDEVGRRQALNGESVQDSFPQTKLYQMINDRFAGICYAAASLASSATKIYRKHRWQLLHGQCSLPVQRSWPVPLLHNKSIGSSVFDIQLDYDGNVIAHLRLLDNRTYTVRLRGGSNYRRNLRTIRACVASGDIGDSRISVDRKRGNAVLGIACKLPKYSRAVCRGTLTIQTARDAFIIAVKETSRVPFTINGDHVKRWLMERKRKQERLSQDRKSGGIRKYVMQKQSQVSKKYNDRLDAFTHEAAANIVKHARRRRVALVEYDDTIKSYYGPSFPYHSFKTKLAAKCEQAGIDFVDVTPEWEPADIDDPHVYFLARANGNELLPHVYIGQTRVDKGRRQSTHESYGAGEAVILCRIKCKKSELRKRESYFHSLFAKSRHVTDGGRKKDWFDADTVIPWLREVGCLGNAGNVSQLRQYIDV